MAFIKCQYTNDYLLTLIWKSFCIDQAADSKRGRKDMDFFDLARFGIC